MTGMDDDLMSLRGGSEGSSKPAADDLFADLGGPSDMAAAPSSGAKDALDLDFGMFDEPGKKTAAASPTRAAPAAKPAGRGKPKKKAKGRRRRSRGFMGLRPQQAMFLSIFRSEEHTSELQSPTNLVC